MSAEIDYKKFAILYVDDEEKSLERGKVSVQVSPEYLHPRSLTLLPSIGIQLVCLTIAPAFIAGGIYLTLKHMWVPSRAVLDLYLCGQKADLTRIIIYGAQFSRIAPRWYTWIFVTCDILSILIQS